MTRDKKYYQIFYSYRRLINLLPRISKGDAEFLKRAYKLAEQAHEDQTREPRTPFFYHPTRVAAYVIELAHVHDIETISVALLHDTIENTDLTLEEIEEELSSSVAKMVDVLSKPWKSSKAKRKDNDRYILRIVRSNDRCKIIKLCDRIDNTSSLPFSTTKDPEMYIKETFRKHVQLIGKSSTDKRVRRLRSVLIEACLEMMDLYQ